jgi:hypothetical protein
VSATHFAVVFDDEIRGVFLTKGDAVELAADLVATGALDGGPLRAWHRGQWCGDGVPAELLCIEMWRGRQYIGTYNSRGELAETRKGRAIPGR